MLKKAFILFSIFWLEPSFAQELSIFFLKDGSILQGKVVNENQRRVFLKTEQGTIKILHQDILGRENLAKGGDLTFLKDQIDYIQSNLNHVSGNMTFMQDSLKGALNELFELYRNLEVLQNEFEIDLLRVHAQTRDQKTNLKTIENQLSHNKVDIAAGKQSRGMMLDTLTTLSKTQKKIQHNLDVLSNQSYLISGTVNQLDNVIQNNEQDLDSQQNQFNIISNSLANIIRDVEKIKTNFSQLNQDITSNRNNIETLTSDLKNQTELLADDIKTSNESFNQLLNRMETLIHDVESKTVTNKKETQEELKRIDSELKKLNSTLSQPTSSP